MISLLATLLALQTPTTIPTSPVGVGPYEGRILPPPLVLNELEQEMWKTFGASKIVMFTTCDSLSFKARVAASAARMEKLNERLAKAIDRARGGQIVRDSLADLKHASIPGCPAPAKVESRLVSYEKSIDALEAALKRDGH